MENAPTFEMPFILKDNPVLHGHLYLVSTPIGNLGDITLRALSVLQRVDLIAAEDTRTSSRLLKVFGIEKPLLSLHEHNEMERSGRICELLEAGKAVALVSDAGTPTLSDPGFVLVREVLAKGFPVVPIPGVSAAITLMSASGLPTDRFLFCGFPPKKAGKRKKWLEELAAFPFPVIFYLSPHGILDFLEEAKAAFGDRQAALGREMTKLHEEFLRGSLSEIALSLSERGRMRGEFSLVVAGFVGANPCVRPKVNSAEPEEISPEEILDSLIQKSLASGKTKDSQLAKELSKRLNLDRKEIYERILSLKKS